MDAIARTLSPTLPLLGKAHEDSDYTVVIAANHWRLRAKTHRAGKVLSAVKVLVFSLGRHCWLSSIDRRRRSTEHGPHVACVLIRMRCDTYRRVATGCNAATRSAVAPQPEYKINGLLPPISSMRCL